MKLLQPKDGNIQYPLPGIPDRLGNHTGFHFIAMAEDSGSGYVCFTNKDMNQVWIEKFSRFQAVGQFTFDMLEKIDDDGEFNAIHTFLVEQEILDAIQGV